jgi:hypothetical protein
MKVYELLDTKDKLARYTLAKNQYGQEVSALHSDACQWCMLGAMFRCYMFDTKEFQRVNKLVTDTVCKGSCVSISFWGDCNSYESIIELCKKLDI